MYKALKIKKNDRLKARSIAATLNSSINRKIALVDMLGLDITYKYYSKLGMKFNSVNCLHKIPFALEEFRISDLHYNGNSIYVVTIFNENFIRIPRIHFNLNLVPNYYIITEVNKDLDSGIVGGYITPRDVLRCPSDTNYYYPSIKDLKDPEELVYILSKKRPTVLPFGKHQDAMSLFCKVLDNTITGEEKRRLLAHLLSCPMCLGKLLATFSFDGISKKMTLIDNSEQNKDTNRKNNNSNRVYSADFGKKVNILNEALPSTEKGMSNLKFLLNTISEDNSQQMNKIPNITISLDDVINFVGKIFTVLLIILNYAKKYLRKLTKKQMITFSIALAVFFTITTIISNIKSNKITEKEPQAQEIPYEDNYMEMYNSSPLSYASNISGIQKTIEIKDISWDVDKKYASKEDYKNFLQVLGKTIKLNLQNEFILLEEKPKNKALKLEINFSNNASIKNIAFITSSGNQRIDKKILDTLYETLSYIKAPRNGFMMPDLNLMLNINLY